MSTRTLPRERGLRLWFAVVGPIAAWMTHLVFVSAVVRYACTARANWTAHAVTFATAVITVVAMVMSYSYARAGDGGPADDAGPASRIRFLGRFGLFVGAFNLALILLEGSYVIFISSCH